jgi:hypothetical protein
VLLLLMPPCVPILVHLRPHFPIPSSPTAPNPRFQQIGSEPPVSMSEQFFPNACRRFLSPFAILLYRMGKRKNRMRYTRKVASDAENKSKHHERSFLHEPDNEENTRCKWTITQKGDNPLPTLARRNGGRSILGERGRWCRV